MTGPANPVTFPPGGMVKEGHSDPFHLALEQVTTLPETC